jgi:hypothetical protein
MPSGVRSATSRASIQPPLDPPGVAPAKPTNDRILYIGLNEDSAQSEAAVLAARTARLVRIAPSAESTVAFEGMTYDLAAPSGPRLFAAALASSGGMTAEAEARLASVLEAAPEAGRDELARVAIAWAPAERGAVVPSRVVLSGHSSAGLLWGQHATFGYATFRALAACFPAAARQIEDVHLSGCFTEREVQASRDWTAVFPNLKTLWGYREFCPARPAAHLTDWELATRGRASRIGESFASAHSPGSAWSIAGGVVGASQTLEERRAAVADADTRFDAWLSGERPITHPHQPDADRDYAAYQMLAAHPDASLAERRDAAKRGAQLLRLRFYDQSVRGEFARAYGAAVDAGLSRLGLPPADLVHLSRADAIAVAQEAAARAPAAPTLVMRRALSLLTALTDLREDVIPDRFCH